MYMYISVPIIIVDMLCFYLPSSVTGKVMSLNRTPLQGALIEVRPHPLSLSTCIGYPLPHNFVHALCSNIYCSFPCLLVPQVESDGEKCHSFRETTTSDDNGQYRFRGIMVTYRQ